MHAEWRREFVIPTNAQMNATGVDDDQVDQPCAYFCGNSLGLLAKRSQVLIDEEIRVWATRAVEGHFSHPHGRPWMNIADHITPLYASLVGSREKEVACMGTLTANLHLMLGTFYNPTPERYKILCEAGAFPSDQYAFASQASFHGFDPRQAVLELSPRQGEFCLREADILKIIKEEGPSIAVVLFSGVQYYTGQLFPIEAITQHAQAQGCICGWDLAHAIGNVPLLLHDWGVDFAVWCSYKYLNSGPGGIAGLFMHEKWNDRVKPMFAGWWGHDPSTRFQMPPSFSPIAGAQGFQQSNPSVLASISLLGSLRVFEAAGMMHPLRKRSVELTGALEARLARSKHFRPLSAIRSKNADQSSDNAFSKLAFTIITPTEPGARGAQLSLLFLPLGSDATRQVFDWLSSHGVIGDRREPDVIRLSPAPLYNTLEDCERAAICLEEALDSLGSVGR